MKWLLIGLIKVYQYAISPFLGKVAGITRVAQLMQ